jgi:hypothetical protein
MYGEHLVGQPTQFNSALIADLDMIDFASTDPTGFVELLARSIDTGPESGAYCLGAAEVVTMTHPSGVPTQAWDRIVDGAIAYLRAVGIPYGRTKPFLRTRWELRHRPDEW